MCEVYNNRDKGVERKINELFISKKGEGKKKRMITG